ncbi:disease resistance protein RGA5-like [Phragmites australis]|uniref:disease resistance protein RGA5-like n=1 Tax=Phragmites australis TaxID=29695 RepID=UPI002D765FAB|nr:disease resistance protein RGA5-like [Phragmites australis]
MEAAVVSVSHGAMASLLGKLGDLLTDKYKLVKRAKGQIMFLKAELESMHAFLKKMSDTEDPDEQAKCWAKQVRELSYDIEDSIDEFLRRVERESNSKPRGFKGFMERSMNLLTTMNTRYKIAKELEGLMNRVTEVSQRRKRYKIDDAVSKPNSTTIDPRLLALHAETAALVGIDGPRDQLIELMSEEAVHAHQLKVLSIVGFGGLGKTTLANDIYCKLGGQFQCRAFVSVSQKPNIRKILRTILSKAGFEAPKNTNIETWDENELISALKSFLLDKRYLIVIDDIWEASAWDIIRCALPESMNCSRVITTTRIETVARTCCMNQSEYVHKMEPLSEQDSRRLFFKRIFGSEDACPPYLKEVSAEILKKCGGLPLAIITISSLLACQPNKLKEQWEYVRNSLGSSLGGLKQILNLSYIDQILNLSYINLPCYLKTCMLYLGIYPEDYTIDRDDLARQWVAEGFISKAHGMDLEEVAKSYFNELINRSMIQPLKTDYNGEVLSCRVHDMMLDLILHKSREENFISVIDDIQEMTGQHDKIRRLSLHLDGAIDEKVVRSVQLSQTRTLAIFGTSSYLPPFLPFNHLRVLRIETSDWSWNSTLLDFNELCHLFQLRYLKISGHGHTIRLPSNIGGLLQLETLQLEGVRLEEFPSDFVHMSRLLHLIFPVGTKLPDGIGNMKSLRTLHCFDLGMNSQDNIKGLGELTNLTDLQISYNIVEYISDGELAERRREVLRTCLEKLCNLKYLEIKFEFEGRRNLDVSISVPAVFCRLQRFFISDCWFSRVPEWIGQLHSLHQLVLDVEEVLEDDVGMLAKLPSLTHLYLPIRGAPKDKIIIRGSGFPVLKHFRVGCGRISCLTFEAGAMPELETLQLHFNAQGWDRYGAAPAGIEHLSCLKEIFVWIGGCIEGAGARESAESAFRNSVDKMRGRRTTTMEAAAVEGQMPAAPLHMDVAWIVVDRIISLRQVPTMPDCELFYIYQETSWRRAAA